MATPNPKALAAGAVAALLFLLSTAPPSQARPPHRPAGEKKTAQALEDYKTRLLSIEETLQAGNPSTAYKNAEKLLQEMTRSLVSGSLVGELLAVTTVLRAVAAYRLGSRDEGHWHWQVANQLYPQLDRFNMASYEDAITYFKEQDATPVELGPGHPTEGLTGQPTPPKKKKAPLPKVPAAKRGNGNVSVEVLAIIDRDGRVRRPQIRKSEGELTMVYAALEALSQWRFKPAELKGEPVPVFYNLKVNFKT